MKSEEKVDRETSLCRVLVLDKSTADRLPLVSREKTVHSGGSNRFTILIRAIAGSLWVFGGKKKTCVPVGVWPP